MKLSRLLLLVPAAGLLMTGCDSEATVKSISVSGSYLTEYVVGETFSSAGVVVTAEYSDGSKKDVSKEASFSGFSSEAVGSGSVTVSFGGQSTSYAISVVKGLSFSEIVEAYKEIDVEVLIPGYAYAGEAALEPVEDEETEDSYYLITGSSAAEMDAWAAKLSVAGWSLKKDSYGDWEGFYKDTRAYVYFGDWTEWPKDEPLGGIKVVFEYNVFEAEFLEYIYEYFGAKGVKIPEYVSSQDYYYFKLDYSYLSYGMLLVWVDGSTTEELEAYGQALVAAGWTKKEDEEDEYYQFGELEVYAELIDYSEDEGYVGIAFSLPIPEEEEE